MVIPAQPIQHRVIQHVEMRHIVKRFPGVLANSNVSFDVKAGEVHALLGENGAGKSTLMRQLYGLYQPDEGEIIIDGQQCNFHSPADAIQAGIGMIHQHFMVVPTLTVAQNVALGLRSSREPLLDLKKVTQRIRELTGAYGLKVEPEAYVWQLSVGEQQRVEILNALYQNARVLILDEPTSVLTPDEADTLFETLRLMAGEGRTVIFISHKLHEVKAVSDRVTVLRAGQVVATVTTADATQQSLAALMVGHDLETERRSRGGEQVGAEVLKVEDVWADGDRGAPALKGVSLTIRAGEVVAVAGVAGNGQRDLAEAIAGLRPCTKGTIRVGGKLLAHADPRDAFDAGVRYVPEDRLGTGVAPNLSIAMNLQLRSFRRTSFGPLLRLGRMRANAEEAIRRFEIKTSGPQMQTAQLSGGNLQKVVIAREFSGEMAVLVAASPTRGLDVAAVETVHSYLLDAAESGTAVLLLSEDLDEIQALNDRIVVMYEGRLSDVVNRESIEEIGLRMAGGAP